MGTLHINIETKNRLAKLGDLDATYDSVLNQILDHVENCENFQRSEK
jgi:hypothetical protein